MHVLSSKTIGEQAKTLGENRNERINKNKKKKYLCIPMRGVSTVRWCSVLCSLFGSQDGLHDSDK